MSCASAHMESIVDTMSSIMVTSEDSPRTYEYDKHYIIYPQMVWSESRKVKPAHMESIVDTMSSCVNIIP